MSMMSTLFMMASGGGSGSGLIGTAGQAGFGQGPYPGDDADLTALGLTAMDGVDDVTSENYGCYQHTNGSVVVCVPWHLMRVGNANAPSYSIDGVNALEVMDYDESMEGVDGWFLPRAFIDGGEIKQAYFIDKYLCSKDSTGKIAVSVKNKDPISLSSSYQNSSSMTGCVGQLKDAITLGKARGTGWSCCSMAIWANISMLSLAHGQAATSAEACGWYDSAHSTNFPKGNNANTKGANKDTNDKSISFTNHVDNGSFSKTGSANPLNKTTHNGQNCGICDVNGNFWQVVIGTGWVNGRNAPLKESYKISDITTSNVTTASMYEDPGVATGGNGVYWGSGSNACFFTDVSGPKRGINGMYPPTAGVSSSGTNLFGKDYIYSLSNMSYVPIVGGYYNNGSLAGVFFRYDSNSWSRDRNDCSFRAAGYAP